MKTNIILISHGELSKGMANSAQMIVGKNENISYYGLYPGGHPLEIIKQIKERVKRNSKDLYLIVADLFGGSMCNAAMELLEYDNVRLISGMNLALVIELLSGSNSLSNGEIIEKVKMAREGIKFIEKESLEKKDEDNKFF